MLDDNCINTNTSLFAAYLVCNIFMINVYNHKFYLSLQTTITTSSTSASAPNKSKKSSDSSRGKSQRVLANQDKGRIKNYDFEPHASCRQGIKTNKAFFRIDVDLEENKNRIMELRNTTSSSQMVLWPGLINQVEGPHPSNSCWLNSLLQTFFWNDFIVKSALEYFLKNSNKVQIYCYGIIITIAINY